MLCNNQPPKSHLHTTISTYVSLSSIFSNCFRIKIKGVFQILQNFFFFTCYCAIFNDFKNILHQQSVILPQHREVFSKIANNSAQICWSDDYGFSGKYMEARIFADMAKSKIENIPFTTPETTGCKTPTICGICVVPKQESSLLWSRAAKGWSKNSYYKI